MEAPGQFGEWTKMNSLGVGGFGQVFLWVNRRTRQKIAIKFCKFPTEHDDDSRNEERWRNEINFASQIRHENIVQGITVDPPEFMAYLAGKCSLAPLIMEYCEKGDLRKKLNKIENLNGLPESEVRNILRSLRNAIAFMHTKGITHRDIKPENLVITDVQGYDVYKVTDLGYARLINTKTMEASHVGTFEYFAPEVITEPSYSNTVDYWSMGIIAFEIICGCRPFLPGSSPIVTTKLLRAKRPEHIAITTNFTSNSQQYHTALFPQNHLSSCLKRMLENWMTIPLSIEPRKRGILAVDRAPDVVPPPRPDLSHLLIFNEIDRILNTKILTVFCLYNCREFSYVLNENTTREAFLENLSIDTGIPRPHLVLILPPDNQIINRDMENTHPLEFFIDGFYDRPMLYCTWINESLKTSRQSVELSQVMIGLLENVTANITKDHALVFARHLLFFVTQQFALNKTFLHGLFNYALLVNDWILKFQGKIGQMQCHFWQLNGSINFYSNQLSHAKQMLHEKNATNYELTVAKLEEDHAKLLERYGKMQKLFEKSKNRYESVLRRSRQIFNELNSHLEHIDDNKADLSIAERFYNKLRESNESAYESSEVVKEMIKFIYRFQENDFLQSPIVKNYQETISEVHVEFELIEKLVDDLSSISQQQESGRLMNQISNNYNNLLWDLAAANACTEQQANTPNLESMLGSLKLNGERMDLSYSSCDGDRDEDDMRSFVVANQQLIDEAQNLLRSQMHQD